MLATPVARWLRHPDTGEFRRGHGAGATVRARVGRTFTNCRDAREDELKLTIQGFRDDPSPPLLALVRGVRIPAQH